MAKKQAEAEEAKKQAEAEEAKKQAEAEITPLVSFRYDGEMIYAGEKSKLPKEVADKLIKEGKATK